VSAQPPGLDDQQEGAEPNRERGKQDMKRDGKRELQPCQQNRVKDLHLRLKQISMKGGNAILASANNITAPASFSDSRLQPTLAASAFSRN
jgi:hypothetical protein